MSPNTTERKEYQVTELNECKGKLRLMTWEAMLVERDDTKCKRCAKRTKFVFGKAEETSLCFWCSVEDNVDVCLSCIPVVLRTRLVEIVYGD